MKKIIFIFSIIFLSACSFKNSISSSPTPTMIQNTPITASVSASKTKSGETYVALKTKNGQIVIKLYQKETPNTVANFLKKADSGFYNNLIFHRVIADFMAQGGDPTGTGTGGGQIKSELNQIPFKRGSLGLARTPVTKEISNDSQFFICFTDDGCQHLTGDYVNFGEVISGFDVLDKIKQGDKILEITTKTK